MQRKLNKKGQINIYDAPNVVMIVGLVFMIIATLAYVGEKYGEGIDESKTVDFVNLTTETTMRDDVTHKSFPHSFSGMRDCSMTITTVHNATTTDGTVSTSNYTQSGCAIYLKGSTANADGLNGTSLNISGKVTWTHDTKAYNVTADLQTELKDNTSITGIILTISLIGIVLTVLIGIFVTYRRRGV